MNEQVKEALEKLREGLAKPVEDMEGNHIYIDDLVSNVVRALDPDLADELDTRSTKWYYA